jgi:peptidoglycan/LPS O-acetylase OafA/YrhL
LYMVLALTIAAAWLVLAGRPLASLAHDIIGAVSFTLNFGLAATGGYFSFDSAYRPLLHLWSLSVEEQFYLVMPIALMIVPRSGRWAVPFGLVVASLVARHEATRFLTGAESFYWPVCRAWELAGGGLAWFAAQGRAPIGKGQVPITLALLSVIVALALVADFGIVPQSDFHPTNQACLAAVCAIGLLWLRADRPWHHPALSPLVRLGNISYALYLVHWPVLVFWRAVTFDVAIAHLPAAALVMLSLVLAVMLHCLVEQPVRRIEIRHVAWPFALALAGAIPLGMAGWAVSRHADRALPDSRTFLEPVGAQAGFDAKLACRHGPGRPTALLFGDSLAAHLVPGLEASDPQLGFIQATRPACGPVFGLKTRFIAFDTPSTAAACLTYTAGVRGWLARHHEIRLVIIAGSWVNGYLARDRAVALFQPGTADRAVGVPYDREVLLRAVSTTVAELRRHGARVVLVAPPPPPLIDTSMCVAAQNSGKWMPLGRSCSFVLTDHRELRAPMDEVLAAIAKRAKVPVFRFDGWLCNGPGCRTEWRGRPLFRDEGHFSPDGWPAFARDIDFARHVESLAQ